MQDTKENLIVDLIYEFSLDVIEYAKLLKSHKKFIIGDQLLRAATSIGANVRDAQNASDFIYKIKIALKEADETQYWLLLTKHLNMYPSNEKLLSSISSIIKVLSNMAGLQKQVEMDFQINTSN